MARTGRYEKEALHKAGVGANRLRVQRLVIRMRVIIAADNCSPTVAYRRAKYDRYTVQTATLSGFETSENGW
jgi:hypothetical protein